MGIEQSMDGIEAWWEQNRPCKEVYGGKCNIRIGPPKWSHRIDRYRSETKTHPTPEQALRAAQNPDTDVLVLRRLAQWDPEVHRAVRDAARANPSFAPGDS